MTYIAELEQVFEKAKSLGERTTSLGAHLYGHVPHVAPQAWLHTTYKGLSRTEIESLQVRIERRFPVEFAAFLEYSNGLNLFSGSLAVFGVRGSYERGGDAAWQPYSIETPNLHERPSDAKSSYLFVGGYFDDGSKLAIDCDTLKVHRLPQRKGGPVLTEWSDFNSMLIAEVRRLSLLFHPDGRLIDECGPTIPS